MANKKNKHTKILMNVEDFVKIKNLYISYHDTYDENYILDILNIYLEDGKSANLLSLANQLLRDESYSFYEFLQYHAFLQDYNIDEERPITPQEEMAIDICMLDFDDDEVLVNEDPQERFKIYKEKFLHKVKKNKK